MNDILDLIDAATGCQQCEGPLVGSPSDEFCSESCQARWQAQRVGARPDPELSLAGLGASFAQACEGLRVMAAAVGRASSQWVSIGVTPDNPLTRIGQEFNEVFMDWPPPPMEVTFRSTYVNQGAIRRLLMFDETTAPTVQEQMQAALEARRNRNTGPRTSQRSPRCIDPRRSR